VGEKIVQKSEIEWLEGMMGVGNTNTICCGGGTINMCSPCGFTLANATHVAQYKDSGHLVILANLTNLSNLSKPVTLIFRQLIH